MIRPKIVSDILIVRDMNTGSSIFGQPGLGKAENIRSEFILSEIIKEEFNRRDFFRHALQVLVKYCHYALVGDFGGGRVDVRRSWGEHIGG